MHKYNYSDEKPEDKLKKSAAQVKRNHPLDVFSVNSKQKKESKLLSFIKGKIGLIKNVRDNILDVQVGKKERENINEGSLSERATNEFLEYYNGLYHEKEPDLKIFTKLVKRNGSPDFGNPYPSDSEEYFKYNTYSIMAADLEVILEGIQRELKQGEILIKDDEEFYEQISSEEKVISILKSFEKNENDDNIKAKKMFDIALQNWAIIIYYGTGCDFLKKQIHNTNIVVATIEMILNVDNNEINLNIEDIVDKAIAFDFINENLAKALLQQRKEINKMK